MGYTHYFKTKKVSQEKFKELVQTAKKLHDNLPKFSTSAGGYYTTDPLSIRDGLGEGKPEFSNNMIDFNGNASLDLDHETFRIENKNENSFCKTARKPYDLLVVAVLIAASQITGLTFSSDAFNQDGSCDDLQDGIDFYNHVCKPKNPITQKTLLSIRQRN